MKNISNIKSIISGIGIFTLLSLVASFCNFLFNFILIRLLTPQEFRDLTLANNMVNVFGNLFVALNIVSIATFFISKEQQAEILRACQKIIYFLYVILLGACVIFSSQVQERTGLHDTIILNLTLAVIFCSIPVMVLNAIYLGSNRFNKSAIMNVCLAFGRLVLGVAGAILIATHKDVAAIGGILVVFVIVFSLFTLLEKEEYRKKNFEVFKRIWDAPVHILKRHRLLVVASVMYAITINFLFGLDLFMFGQFFSNAQSADYAAVSIIGKLVFFFVTPISLYLAAKQQELIHAKPRLALKATLAVDAIIIFASACMALLPLSLISLFIHRPIADINHGYLLLSLLFNSAVVLANHQIIEAIVGKRQKAVVVATGALFAVNGGLFLCFRTIEDSFHAYPAPALALGIPAATMLLVSLILFLLTHIAKRKAA